MKKINKFIIIKCVLFAILSAILSTPLQLFNSIVIEGQTGKPEFVRLDVQERWVVLMHPDDELASCSEITKGKLKKRNLILPSRLNVQCELANWFGEDFDSLSISYTANLSTNAAIMVQKGYANAVVVEGAVPFWNPKIVTSKPLSPTLTATTVLAWRRNQPFGNAAEKFIEELRCLLGIGES